MSLQVIHRPKTLDDLFGNPGVIESIKSVVKRKNPPTTYLFTGPGGTGKTTIARVVASMLGCSDADFKEVNAADDTGIEKIREMREKLKYTPINGPVKCYLLDEAHMISKSSREALLKMMEEPPSFVRFMICTTNPEVFNASFKRRCHQYVLSPLKTPEMSQLIKSILLKEKVNVRRFPKKVIDLIIDVSEGSAGQALKCLDMVIDMKNADNMIDIIQSAGISSMPKEVIDICRILINDRINGKTKWMKISALLKSLKTDGESARRPILGYLEAVLLNKSMEEGEDIARIMANFSENYFDTGKTGLAMSCYLSCMEE